MKYQPRLLDQRRSIYGFGANQRHWDVGRGSSAYTLHVPGSALRSSAPFLPFLLLFLPTAAAATIVDDDFFAYQVPKVYVQQYAARPFTDDDVITPKLDEDYYQVPAPWLATQSKPAITDDEQIVPLGVPAFVEEDSWRVSLQWQSSAVSKAITDDDAVGIPSPPAPPAASQSGLVFEYSFKYGRGFAVRYPKG